MNAAPKPADAVVVRRTIAASAEEVFDAWFDAEALGIWMRPTGIRHTRGWTSGIERLAGFCEGRKSS